MKRSEVIAAIEKLKREGESDAARSEFVRVTQQAQRDRSSLADDFHRAIVYCFIMFTRVGYLNKERRNFLRPTLRSVIMAALLVLFAIIQAIVLGFILVQQSLDFQG